MALYIYPPKNSILLTKLFGGCKDTKIYITISYINANFTTAKTQAGFLQGST